ncbi:MAG: hypothetical protein QME58_10275, partial [Bacteroidota bacterium]|nr:hypothetical protein [Bacteroidota bacterium]
GHRVSEDFDFFTNISFHNERLNSELLELFPNHTISILQNEINTYTCLLNDEVKLSFFKINYENIFPLIKTEYLDIADILEIGIMKILALSRASYKDYVDLYYILKTYDLSELIKAAKKKHKDFNEALYFKCLLSYEDVEMLPIKFMSGFHIDPNVVFTVIEKKVKLYLNEI